MKVPATLYPLSIYTQTCEYIYAYMYVYMYTHMFVHTHTHNTCLSDLEKQQQRNLSRMCSTASTTMPQFRILTIEFLQWFLCRVSYYLLKLHCRFAILLPESQQQTDFSLKTAWTTQVDF